MLRFCSLGSGSAGNALVVEARNGLCTTRILVDNGFGWRALNQRLHRAGLTCASLDAIIVTHEHGDHSGGVHGVLRQTDLLVYASAGTAAAAGFKRAARWRPLQAGVTTDLGDLAIHPVAVPHDAAEPLQFVFDDGDRRLGLLTDTGMPTPSIASALSGVAALILECNHDEDLLAQSRYPPFLRQRIAGDHGHLSNRQAAQLLHAIDRRHLRQIVAAHLSRENNRPELAQAALAKAVGGDPEDIAVADQDRGSGWLDV